jgi:PAS domain S-box-containing protein
MPADIGLQSVLLPAAVRESSAAVLVVDLARGEVTYVNSLGRQLAPDVDLPVGIDAWSLAAGLEDVTGADLPSADSEDAPRERDPGPDAPAFSESLLRVAQGEPVLGEAVTARHATSITTAREPLWVLGLPMTGAPEPVASLALVVFLPLRSARLVAGAQESASLLRDRAVLATRMSFAITDPRRPDNPLVWVNPAFTSTTGYTFAEAVGRNCRFLQGPETDRRVVREIHASLAEAQPITTTVLNYRKDGTPFWNELSISPVQDAHGELTHFVGVQADVTSRIEAQRARDEALQQVQFAAERLSLLADFTARLTETLQAEEIMEQLARVLVPRVCTWCVVYLLDETGEPSHSAVRHERQDDDPRIAELVARMALVAPDQTPSSGPTWQVLRREVGSVLIPDISSAPDAASVSDDERTSLAFALGARSVLVVPLIARDRVLGSVAAVADETRRPYDESDLSLVQDVAGRTALMLENSQLYARQRTAAETLQRSLMPRLLRVPGISAAAVYLTATDQAAVGGDWYDLFALRDGEVGIVVGDAMGHNFDSAAAMGRLSTMLRAYAWPGADPADVLDSVDALLAGTDETHLATCVYARITRGTGGAVLEWSAAGHPPPLLRRPDGSVEVLTDGRGPMLGVSALMAEGSRGHRAAQRVIEPGSVLVCYTDGLADAVGPDLDPLEGADELARKVAEQPADATPEELVAALARCAEGGRTDDLAVLAIRVDPADPSHAGGRDDRVGREAGK